MAKRPLPDTQELWMFEQGNALAHACEKVRNWLSSLCGFGVMQWHAKRSDLNWIEYMWRNVWSRLQKQSDLSPRNIEAATQQEW